MASCIEKLGSNEFSRLRLGVGRMNQEGDLANYVLAPFKKEEKVDVAVLLEKAVEAVATWVSLGPEACMNRYNVKNKKI